MKEIERHILKKIKQAGKTFPVLAIVGPRQVGKTTLVKQYATSVKRKSVYLDLEMPSDFKRINDDAELFLSGLDDCIVIIDEVQRKPDLFPIIRALVDQNRRPLRFILLGSASPDLIQNASETLAGRIAYIELMPFNYTEIADVGSIQKHHIRGGFPKPFLMRNNADVQLWYENFVSTYVERDLPVLGLKASPQIVRKLWQMLAWQNGGIINYSSIGSSLGLSNHTVTRYIDFLEGAFLISRLQPYFFNQGKRLVKAPKIYLRDTGVLHHLLGIDNMHKLSGSPFMGASWEAYVIEQIKSIAGTKFDYYFYRTQTGIEMDLVLLKGIKPVATIEVKYTLSPDITKSIITSIQDLKTEKNFVIIPNGDDYKTKNNILVCSLTSFLNIHLNKI